MPVIYLVSSSEIYSKLFELCLQNYDVEIKVIKDETEFEKVFKNANLIIFDDEFSDSPKKFIDKCVNNNIPLIYLKDVFSDKEPPLEEVNKILILEKPFEENDLLEKIKQFIDLTKGEVKMAEEKKVTSQQEDDDILELTEVVENGESKEEISDILSTEKAGDKILDDFFEEEPEESKEESPKEPTGAIVEDEKTEDEILKSEDLEELMKEVPDESSKPEPMEKEEILEDEEKSEEKIIKEEKQEDIELPTEIEEKVTEEEEKTEEDIKIPVDEEVKQIAEEIENGKKIEKEFEIESEPEKIEEEFLESKEKKKKTVDFDISKKVEKKFQKKEVDLSLIEAKLLEATNKVIEAIEEATVEIAVAIAKSTPKIIEEVSKQIIPAIAKKIISEEINKKEEEE